MKIDEKFDYQSTVWWISLGLFLLTTPIAIMFVNLDLYEVALGFVVLKVLIGIGLILTWEQ